MSTAIDFHAHIVPFADHGCVSTEEAINQLLMMQRAGIQTVVATPHFYPAQDNVAEFIARVDDGMRSLMAQRPEHAPKIFLGSEILLCPSIHKMPGFDQLCIRGTKVCLLELPINGCTDDLMETVEDILSLDYTVVLAHINRYLHSFADQIDYLLDMGALAQVNATSLKGFWNRRRVLPYLESGCVVALGSDLHGQDQKTMDAYAALSKLPNDLFSLICEKSAELLTNAQEAK